MRILLTGASSFTGTWVVRELAAAGHEVGVTLHGPPDAYEGLRRARVEEVLELAASVDVCRFGDERFLAAAARGWDLLAHHGAEVTDYKSPDFDALGALAANTRNLRRVLAALGAGGCRGVVLTGSVFESDEGAGGDGEDELPAFSPYGLSKALTAQVFRHECRAAGLALGKLTIPNPFGPLEEPRFTTYLAREWLAGRTPRVGTPAYVRDNVHVQLLARAYVRFAEETAAAGGGFRRLGPSGYRESQGAFAQRCARELAPRLGVACPLELAEQVEFPEPRVRVNTDPLDADGLGVDEAAAWEALADWYARTAAAVAA